MDPTSSNKLNKLNSTCVTFKKDDVISNFDFYERDQKKSLIKSEDNTKEKGFCARFCKCLFRNKS